MCLNSKDTCPSFAKTFTILDVTPVIAVTPANVDLTNLFFFIYLTFLSIHDFPHFVLSDAKPI